MHSKKRSAASSSDLPAVPRGTIAEQRRCLLHISAAIIGVRWVFFPPDGRRLFRLLGFFLFLTMARRRSHKGRSSFSITM